MIVPWDTSYTPSWQGWGGGVEPAWDGGAWRQGARGDGLGAVPSFCAAGFVGPLSSDQQALCSSAGTVDTLQLPDGSVINLDTSGGSGSNSPAVIQPSIIAQLKPYALPIGLGLGAVLLFSALRGRR